jgi:predicted SAM-dependent methyltransferase
MIALNIGCHDIHMSEMINIDNDPEMKPDLLLDCTKLLDHFQEKSVDFVYAGHFFEHFSISIGMKIVSDIFKILRPYGSLIVTIPDYSKCNELSIEEADRIIFAEDTHKVLMNFKRVKEYLKSAGFATVIEAKPNELAHCPFPNIEWQTSAIGLKHPPVSFYGIK